MKIVENGFAAVREFGDLIMMFDVKTYFNKNFDESDLVVDDECEIHKTAQAIKRLNAFARTHPDTKFAWSYDTEKTVLIIGAKDFSQLPFFIGDYQTAESAYTDANRKRVCNVIELSWRSRH